MYCPACGAESAEGLRFCKQCGSGLTTPLNVEYVKPVRITGAVWAIAVMAFLCFGALFGSVIAMVGMGVRSEDVIVPVTVPAAFSIFGICALLIRLVSRAMGTSVPINKEQSPGKQALRSPYNQAQIPPPQPYIPSVTENTTRSFDRQPGESSSR
jgi:hypothetical protein